MRIGGKVAVVTGGASGIGRALALAFAAQGAEGVVVADINADGAAAVAAEIAGHGGLALSAGTDVTSQEQVSALVRQAEHAFGRVDVFCSNAGIIVAGGVEVPDEAWERIWAVNVQSHIYAARALLPGMLAREDGYLVITASAAGLLTQLGSAPYAVTKHAAVALAEWLAISHGAAGLKVSCLCPQAVTTSLGATSQREIGGVAGPPAYAEAIPSTDAGSVSRQAAVDGVLTPEDVAAAVIDALAAERFLILPHPEVATYERRRAEDRDRWLGGMRRLHARLTGKG